MIRWTGLAPWGFEFPFRGGRTSTFLVRMASLEVLLSQGLGVEDQIILMGCTYEA